MLGLFIIISLIINIIYEDDKDVGKSIKRGSLITCLIIFGIIYGIRATFEMLGSLSPIFRIFNNDQMFLAIMVTIYYPLHKPIIKKFGISISSDAVNHNYSKFSKFWIIFIVITWVIAGIFLTIPILNIPMENPDIFNLSILWTFVVICVNLFFTYTINRTLPKEQRIAKIILRKSMFIASLFAFGIWCTQLLIFELYLNRWLQINLIKQDIRVLIIVVSGLYIIFFFNSFKTRFLPDIRDKGSQRVKELLQSELGREVKYSNSNEVELTLEDRNSISKLIEEDKSLRPPEGITFKIHTFFSKKFDKSLLSDEDVISSSVLSNRFNIILIALLWGIMVGVLVISISLITFTIGKILLASWMSATFMIFFDFSIIILFNRINPVRKRISKEPILNTILFGGIITFWIWILPIFIIYSYLFVWLNDSNIMFITRQVIYSIIMYYIGTRVLMWYAGSVKMWNKSKRKASRVSFIWIIINMPLRLLLTFETLLKDLTPLKLGWIIILSDISLLIINIIIGAFLVFKIYRRKLIESLRLVVGVQIILFFTTIALLHLKIGNQTGGGILRFFETLITSYHYSLEDFRIALIVVTGIYLISYYFFSRIEFSLDTSEQIKEKVRLALELTEGVELEASMAIGNNVILDVEDLTTYFYTEEGVVKAVEGVSFQIHQGEVLGLVGETGCGKSVTALSILRLVRPPGEIKRGQVIFEGEDLHQKSLDEFLRYRGNKITMIFQDPLNSLNPVFKIGDQISEVYRLHMEDELLLESVRKNTGIYDIARKWSQNMLKDLNIPTPRVIFDRYPHELSGGMRQRVQIAMALACSPKLLIADEPTTALDVTIQNQILKLMKDLKKKYNTSILFITHDLGIISKMCDRVAVMYSGFIVEYGDIEKLFITPYHPYTRGLISSVPVVGKKRELLDVIPGTVPNLIYPPSGCRFHPRCQYCFEPCDSEIPKSIEMQANYYVACHLYDPKYKNLAEISIRKVESQKSIT
ncbi:MAG: ABC transporter ATP-binding protein [Candidatus Thorarchaeota archaeon]